MRPYRLITLIAAVRTGAFGAVALASVLVSNTSIAAAPTHCDVRLTVELTPDIPEPSR
jgi:hypothetical protein